jgi:hypothetical protein
LSGEVVVEGMHLQRQLKLDRRKQNKKHLELGNIGDGGGKDAW